MMLMIIDDYHDNDNDRSYENHTEDNANSRDCDGMIRH